MPKYNLLGVGTNAKTVKGDGAEYITAIMYLSPADKAEGINVCPMAVMAGCKAGCLYTAGRGSFNSVQQARLRKTILFRDYQAKFMATLRQDLDKFQAYCLKKNVTPVVRLNGTSDIYWENKIDMVAEYPDIQFYDYTKIPKRVINHNRLPSNYHLTLSYSEATTQYKEMCIDAMAKNPRANLAVVFRNKEAIPAEFLGRKVIDGDKDDLRFLDEQGVVVALYAKGRAKKDASGFVMG